MLIFGSYIVETESRIKFAAFLNSNFFIYAYYQVFTS